MSDVWDILEMGGPTQSSRGEQVESEMKKIIKTKGSDDFIFSKKERNQRKPEGMSRELFALLASDNKGGAPIIHTDFSPAGALSGGYKQIKAKLGIKKARAWKWIPFVNAGRTDGFMLSHWRRATDEGKEYPFAKFATKVSVPSYTDVEYQQLLQTDGWTKAETDHLFALCKRFDLRFIVIHDRWNRSAFPTQRSVEDLKERYYNAVNILSKARTPPGQEPKMKYFDADHERRRKEQLTKLYDRTAEQVEEEQKLLEELRKIEMRKKEREKKTQDLQKLITAADKNTDGTRTDTPGTNKTPGGPGRHGPGRGRKRTSHLYKNVLGRNSDPSTPNATSVLDSVGIKFPEIKSSGVSLRSHKMKLPGSVGTKKAKAIEQLLIELNVDLKPMPTEEICQHFNELRSDMVLLYELKMALASSEFELQTLKHQYEALQPTDESTPSSAATESAPGQPILPASSTGGDDSSTNPTGSSPQEAPKKAISEVIDVDSCPGSSMRKRKAALQQENLLKKLKKP